jgi:hypothetical protein
VILDDVDACRLLVPGGEPPIGLESLLRFVAVVSEQLSQPA